MAKTETGEWMLLRNASLVRSRRLGIESLRGPNMVVFDEDTGRRLEISAGVYEVLQKFAKPVAVQQAIGPELFPALGPVLAKLVEANFLKITGEQRASARRPLAVVSPTLFRCPGCFNSDQPDVVVVGIPYDGGNIIGPGCRFGPSVIRVASCAHEYRVEFESKRPLGWFDADTGKRVLQGVSIADWGDIQVDYGEYPETLFDRISEVCSTIVKAGALPVFLGGDHSISFPIVRALQDEESLCVVWLDAHNDCSRLNASGYHHHGSVVTRILQLPNLKRVISVGQRGFLISNQADDLINGLGVVTAKGVRKHGSRAVLDHIPSGSRCYLSIDIDVLDPAFAPGTSTPVPGGLHPDEIKSLISDLAAQVKIVGLDLVEVNCTNDPIKITALQACHSLMGALAAVMRARHQGEKNES